MHTHYSADDEVVILDFETTGLSPPSSRIIEVGAAIVKGDSIRETFESLCNPGSYVPSFITSLTGITNEMLRNQPSPEKVMAEFHEFAGDRPIIAHNASFDGRFLKAEMSRIGHDADNPMLCTMLLARRLIDDSHGHKLGTLKSYLNYKEDAGHRDHRALADVKVTAALWVYLRKRVESIVGRPSLAFREYQKISKISKNRLREHLESLLVVG